MSAQAKTRTRQAAFDVVGRYSQDQINGFSDELINDLVVATNLYQGCDAIELMGGDGNFVNRLAKFNQENDLKAKLSLLEYSRVQSEFARMELEPKGVEVIWGDVLSMSSLEDGTVVRREAFDRAVIKSSNHEIPARLQEQLYANVASILRPGGYFTNLGFLYDNTEERNEMREIARAKDSLAGMDEAVRNRHFMTREELYQALTKAGFCDIQARRSFFYRISSEVVASQYFSGPERNSFDGNFQAAQAKARTMRKLGRMQFVGEHSLMLCPGEITVARKPATAELAQHIYRQYPYDFLRHIEVHRALMAATVQALHGKKSIADLGCGLGLLAERLSGQKIRYHGLDLLQQHVEVCRERFASETGFSFAQGDVNECNLTAGNFDAIALINVLYQQGVAPHKVLAAAFAALPTNGVLVVSGPTSAGSFASVEEKIKGQLQRDGHGDSATFGAIQQANAQLLSKQGNYFTVEAMIELLSRQGFIVEIADASHYYGEAFFIVARKPA